MKHEREASYVLERRRFMKAGSGNILKAGSHSHAAKLLLFNNCTGSDAVYGLALSARYRYRLGHGAVNANAHVLPSPTKGDDHRGCLHKKS